MVPRTSYYCPELTSDGPEVDNLLPTRMTIIKPLDGSRPKRIDDDWTTEPQAQNSQQWTGATNFEEKPSYKEQLEEDEEDKTGHQSKSYINAKATNRTRDHGTQVDSHALQIMFAYRDEADQMHIPSEAAAEPSSKSTLHSSKALRISTQHQYRQLLTSKRVFVQQH